MRPPAARAHASHRSTLDLAIEAAWLAAVACVPLAFSGRGSFLFFSEPKTYLLHLAGLAIAVLWTAELFFKQGRFWPDWRPGLRIAAMRSEPRTLATLVVVSGAGYFTWALLSTLASPLPFISFIGRDPANPGGESYSLLSTGVIFLALALRLKTAMQFKRLLWAAALAGTVAAAYGVAQHLGWDPFGHLGPGSRAWSTAGNPIYFGSLLVLTMGATMLLLAWQAGDGRFERLQTAILLAAISLQAAGLWSTASRGPFIGGIALLFLAAMLTAWFYKEAGANRRTAALVGAACLCAVASALGASLVSSMAGAGSERAATFVSGILEETREFVPAPIMLAPASSPAMAFAAVGGRGPAGGALQVDAVPSPEPAPAQSLQDAAVSRGQIDAAIQEIESLARLERMELPQSSLDTRVGYWRASLKLAQTWPWFPREDRLHRSLRPAFGYGPDLAYHAFPLVLWDQSDYAFLSHAHSMVFQTLVEMGWGGLILLLLTFLFATLTGVVMLAGNGEGRSRFPVRACGAIFVALLAGRFAEQWVGISRTSDQLVFWALGGGFAALAMRIQPDAGPKPGGLPRIKDLRPSEITGRAAAGFLIVPAVFLAAALFYWSTDVQAARASRMAVKALRDLNRHENQRALDGFLRAAATNGYSEFYVSSVAQILRQSAALETDLANRDENLLFGQRVLANYEERYPYPVDAQRQMLLLVRDLVGTGRTYLVPELVYRSRRIALQYPSSVPVRNDAREVLLGAYP